MMEIVHDLAYSIGIDPGWIGVLLGIILFLLGRYQGNQNGRMQGANDMILLLEENGFLKVKSRVVDPDTGTERVEYSKVDD